jgi:3-deoxy-D-manno-octulosonate 8-phosphate phosphatase (KDO 8-P phosphatase)
MLHDTQLLQRLGQIRLVVLDVDGTMTDGGVYLGEAGEVKRFDIQDGAGIVFMQQVGIEVAVVSGRTSRCVEQRCKELGIKEVHQGVKNKLTVFEHLVDKKKLIPLQVAVMGDDLQDLPLMTRAGISVSPANGVREVRVRAAVVTHAPGGAGAVREFAELLLKAQDRWHDVLGPYLE